MGRSVGLNLETNYLYGKDEASRALLDGVEAGREEIYTDPFAEEFGEQYQASPKTSERRVAAMAAEEAGDRS